VNSLNTHLAEMLLTSIRSMNLKAQYNLNCVESAIKSILNQQTDLGISITSGVKFILVWSVFLCVTVQLPVLM